MAGNPMTSEDWVRLMDTRLTRVTTKRFSFLEEEEDWVKTFFKSESSTTAWNEYMDTGTLPIIPKFNGKLQYLNFAPGYTQKIEPAEFAAGIKFERKLIDDELYGVMDSRAEKLMESAHYTRQWWAIRFLANATSVGFDFMTSEEGKPLCSSTHLSKSGASTTNGFSNAGTTALNPTSVEATRILMRQWRQDNGRRIIIHPDTIIVPDNLKKTLEEIVGTEKGLYSAEGTKNVQYNAWKQVVCPWLDDYDSNDWYMADMSKMKEFNLWLDRITPETHNYFDFETFYIALSIYFRFGWGQIDWRFMYKQTVA